MDFYLLPRFVLQVSFTSLHHHLHLQKLLIIRAEEFQPFPEKFTVSFWTKFTDLPPNPWERSRCRINKPENNPTFNPKQSSESTSSLQGGKGAALFKSLLLPEGNQDFPGAEAAGDSKADTRNKVPHLHSINKTWALWAGVLQVFLTQSMGKFSKPSLFDCFN